MTVNTWRSNSTNALSFSSAWTIKRFPSPRCASEIQIVCPLESMADTRNPNSNRLYGLLTICGVDLLASLTPKLVTGSLTLQRSPQ